MLHQQPKKLFITFGGPSEDYKHRSQELAASLSNNNNNQSKQQMFTLRKDVPRIFDNSIGLTDAFLHIKPQMSDMENESSQSFWQKHGDFISQNPRGYGYWLWKPYIIKTFLDKIADNDILVYADAGCNFNPNGIKRLYEYFDILNSDKKGVLAFQLNHSEYKYCKRQVFDELLTDVDQEQQRHIMTSGQCMATVVLLRKTAFSQEFVNSWLEMAENHSLINDDKLPNEYPGFIDHRHDQAIYSVLAKMRGITMIPDETWFLPNWQKWGDKYPFWATRQRR